MSLKYASLLKLSAAGIVLLSVGACKPADKGQGALKSEGIAALNLSKSEASVFAKYFPEEDCAVDEMEAYGALAGLGMGENGANNMEFSSRAFENGKVTYRDIVVGDDATKTFTAKSAVFHCPSMGDEAPGFTRLDLTDAVAQDGKGATFTFGTLNIAKPSAFAAGAIVDSIINPDASSQDSIEFDALSATDVTLKSDDVFGSLKTLSWGQMDDDKGVNKADFTLDNLDVTVPGKNNAEDMTFVFEGMSVRNLNMNEDLDTSKMSTNGMLTSAIGNLNIFTKPYDQLLVEKMKVNSEGFAINFNGMEGKTTEKGDVITTRQTLKPMTVTLKPALADEPSFQRNYEILKTLGFDEMEMSGSSITTLNKATDSVAVSDGLFVIEDALALNFEYSAEGLNDMIEKAQTLSETGGTSEMMTIYETLKLRGFRLTLEDNSIVERGLKLATQMTGQSEKNIKRSLGMASIGVAMMAQNDLQAEVYSESIEAFSNFVKKGGTLTIEANPPSPFPLATLLTNKGEDVDPAALGFSASQSGGAK